MALGYSYTLLSNDMLAPPVMTGHAMREADAIAAVESMMTRNREILSGIVRDLDAPASRRSMLCLRGKTRLLWIPR